jgi:transposase InsO family protein
LLEISSLSKSLYYYYFHNEDKQNKHEKTEEMIFNIFKENKGRYGYRRIVLALRNEYGLFANHKLVRKIMKKYGLIYKARRHRKYSSYRGTVGKVAPNVLRRQFAADGPFQKWATDITEFNINGSKSYLSPIIDMYNEEIISYSISTSPNMNLVLDMLEKAFKKLPPHQKPILHSDQGWHYQHPEYQARLRHRGIVQSMSRKGNCLDNSVMENFFGKMKMETIYLYHIKSMSQMIDEINKYISYYNFYRIKEKLGGYSPVDYRKMNQKNL